jgi:hypothetical protein
MSVSDDLSTIAPPGGTPRTYSREAYLAVRGLTAAFDLLDCTEGLVDYRATEAHWNGLKESVSVWDTGGSYQVGSIDDAIIEVKRSRYRVTRMEVIVTETDVTPAREVVAQYVPSSHSLWVTVSGPHQAEVIGLAALIEEELADRLRRRRWRQRLRAWWRSQRIWTQLLVGVIASLIAAVIVAAF